MEMTLSRKVLNVAGILDYIAGGLSLLLGFVIIGAGAFAMKDPELAQDLPTELGAQAVLIVGIAIAVGAIFTMIYAHLERAAAKNPAKIMPVWVLSVLSAALSVGSLISSLVQHAAFADMRASLVSLAFSILMLIIANNIKKEAGK